MFKVQSHNKSKVQSPKSKALNQSFAVTVFAFLIFSFVFSPTVSAQENPPAPLAPRSVTIPTPQEKTLPNGLRVIVIERKNVPLVTAQLLIKNGGEVDPQNLAGTADMTAELLTKGTKTRTATQIAEQIEFLGGSLESNAGWDSSEITFSVLSDKFDNAMAIASDVVQNPTFKQDEIDRYKTQLLDELEVSLKQPATIANYVANRIVFGEESYGHPLTGTPESINRIKQTDLITFHKKNFRPDNSALIIIGNISPDNAFTLALKHFGKWIKPNSKRQVQEVDNSDISSDPFQITGEPKKVSSITVVNLPDSGQAAVSFATYGITRGNDKYFQGIVANTILGGGFSSRLNQEIRIKRGLSYGAGSNLSARKFGGIFLTRTQTKNESAAEVADLVLMELNRLGNETVSAGELTPRKATIIGNFSRELETNEGLIGEIAKLALYDIKLNNINTYIQNVQLVNGAGVEFFAKGILNNPINSKIIIVGDAKKFLPDLQKRFDGVKINVIPIAELDLNNADLRKAK